MTVPKINVLLFGPTGVTGSSIVEYLLQSPAFNVFVAVRPASKDKPAVTELQGRGAQVRLVDLETADVNSLKEALAGMDTVICALTWDKLQLQWNIIDAAKAVGVKRFVPSDWGTPCVRGVRGMYDEKIDVRDYIRKIGLNYTFIDIGFWFQMPLPILDEATAWNPDFIKPSKFVYNGGTTKCSFTDNRDIGKFVAKIVADPRTLNHYVFCYAEELTQNDIMALAREVSGKEFDTIPITEAELLAFPRDGVAKSYWEYMHSLWIRGDNTAENAVKPEYGSALIARELYPDIQLRRFKDFAAEFYNVQ